MSGFLLDTNVISEFNRRGEPDRLVKQWLHYPAFRRVNAEPRAVR
jgi:predicted nucleic acid-binding protein